MAGADGVEFATLFALPTGRCDIVTNMEGELNIFEEMLAAAAGRIGPEYFQLPIADADAVYRERVYCYELYHQLRRLWDGFPFSLGGEVDKGGHPYFQDGPYAHAKPDLLVHVPGTMDGNLACIEVKPAGRPIAEFSADLRKLTWFCLPHHSPDRRVRRTREKSRENN
jgi:hypothetical protein